MLRREGMEHLLRCCRAASSGSHPICLCCSFVPSRSQAVPDRPNFVKASFGPPLINFLGLTIESGPKSSVNLAATYVDDRVRSKHDAKDSSRRALWYICFRPRPASPCYGRELLLLQLFALMRTLQDCCGYLEKHDFLF